MAQCVSCGRQSDCSCTFKDGKHCDSCYYLKLAQGEIKPKKDNTCGQTLEYLQSKLDIIGTKYADKKAKRLHYKAILNSQIAKLETDPCKYYDIILGI